MLITRKRRTTSEIQTVLAGYKVVVSFKISDHVRFGPGEWDKIPFSIGLSVDLPTYGSDDMTYLAGKVAEAKELVFTEMRDQIMEARKRIRSELCAERFE